ncbi:MAG: GNAT family N-acetyltransferase [Alphaproteobacteria bacterium]|nr:GNAT family N-acetyltransferase [Alphaproteobacteria bacterium]
MSANSAELRQAQRGDLEAIVAMLADDDLGSGREDASLPLAAAYVDAFKAIDTDPNQLLAVAKSNGQVVGTLQLTFMPGLARTGLIEAVRIAKSFRSSGLGQQMFEWAIGQCKARGCGLVQLTTDKSRPDAHRFYDRLGFEASHIGYKLKL